MDPRRLGALAGLVTAPVYMAAVLAQDLLRTDFDPVQRAISELATGPQGWIQVVNFIAHGILTVVLAYGVRAELELRQVRPVAAHLLTAVGIATILAGIFVTDTGAEMTWHGGLHLLMGLALFCLFPVVTFMLLRHFKRWPEWRFMTGWTGATMVITATFWVLIVPGSGSSTIVSVAGPIIGAIQRVAIGMWSLWIFVLAVGLLRSASPDAGVEPGGGDHAAT